MYKQMGGKKNNEELLSVQKKALGGDQFAFCKTKEEFYSGIITKAFRIGKLPCFN